MPLPTMPSYTNALNRLTEIVAMLPGYMKSRRDQISAGEVSREVVIDVWINAERNRVALVALAAIPGFDTHVDSQFYPGVLGGTAATMLTDAVSKLIAVRDAAKALIPVDGSGNILGYEFDDASGTVTTADTTGLDKTALLAALNDLLTWAEGA